MAMAEVVAGDAGCWILDAGLNCGLRIADCGLYFPVSVLCPLSSVLSPSILSDGNEFHFRRDDSLPRVIQLRNRVSTLRAQRLSIDRGLRIADCGLPIALFPIGR